MWIKINVSLDLNLEIKSKNYHAIKRNKEGINFPCYLSLSWHSSKLQYMKSKLQDKVEIWLENQFDFFLSWISGF